MGPVVTGGFWVWVGADFDFCVAPEGCVADGLGAKAAGTVVGALSLGVDFAFGVGANIGFVAALGVGAVFAFAFAFGFAFGFAAFGSL